LFFIPGKGGYPTRIRHLAKKIDKNTPIYALQDLMEHEQGPSKNKEFPSTAAFYINQIKRLYPQGPYYLVGESLGGKLALEMAQQLREAGDEVPILAMLDTYHNDGRVMNKLMEPKNRQIYYRMLFNKHWTILRDSDWAGRWDYFKFYRENILEKISKRIKRFISKGKNSPAAALPEKIKRLEEANLQADQEYVSQYYPGKVIFFKALLGPNSGVENNGWEIDEFGEFVIHELNCYHGSILFEPIVSQVAEVIQHYIDLETSQTE
jgi:thioesterase domain-containing protein